MKRSRHPARLRGSLGALGALGLIAVFGNLLSGVLLGQGSLAFAWTDGTRGTLAVAGLVLAVGFGVGMVAGAASALGPPLADALLSRAMEIAGALPSVVVVVIVQALRPAPELIAVGAVLAALRGLATAKGVRAELLQLQAEDFVMAARALGTTRARLFRKHLFPHVAGPSLASASLSAAAVVGLDAALSLAGFGTTSRTWGSLLAEAAAQSAPAIALGPLIGVATTVASLLSIADAIEDRWSVGQSYV